MEASHLLKTSNEVCLATSESSSAFGLLSGNIKDNRVKLGDDNKNKKGKIHANSLSLLCHCTATMCYKTYAAKPVQFKFRVQQQYAISLTSYNALRSHPIKT
jgi:hypothetical protein